MRLRSDTAFKAVIIGIHVMAGALLLFGWLTRPVHAAQRRGMSIRSLISGCSVDARSNPLVLSCPGGCMVTIANGVAGGPPQVQIGAACRALK